MKKKHTLFSLFSGAGGLDLGFQLSSVFDTVFANDVLHHATKTYSRNFNVKHATSTPAISNLPAVYQGDVSDLKFSDFETLEPDVIAGGPPCQDFSVVRGPQKERRGTKVSRGRLYSYFIAALFHLQPKIFIFENVPGLKSANEGEAYRLILDDFTNLNIRWSEVRRLIGNTSNARPKEYEIIFEGIVNASELGVPQARRRVIVIGLRKDLANSIWWKIEAVKRKVANGMESKSRLLKKYPLTPLEVFEGKPLSELGSQYEEIMKSYKEVVKEVNTNRANRWEKDVWKKLSFDVIQDYILVNRTNSTDEEEVDTALVEHRKLLQELEYSAPISDLTFPDESNKIPKESPDVLKRMKRIPPDENHEFVRGTEWEVEGKGISLIYRRLHPLKPSYTIVAHGGGGTWGYHYERHRSKLTNRERARLQTFPDDFVFEGNISEVRAQIGEAVPPLMAKRIAETLLNILEEL